MDIKCVLHTVKSSKLQNLEMRPFVNKSPHPFTHPPVLLCVVEVVLSGA